MPKRHIELPFDQMRKIKYDINSMVELEEMFGGGLQAIFTSTSAGFTSIRALIYVGLKCAGDKRITLEATGELLSQYVLEPGKPIEDVLLLAMEALNRGGFVTKAALDEMRKAVEKKAREDAGEDVEDEENDESPPAPIEVGGEVGQTL